MLNEKVIDKIYFLCKQRWGNTAKAEDIAHDTIESILRWPPKEDLNNVKLSYFKTLVHRSAGRQNGGRLLDHNHVKSIRLDSYQNFIEVTTTNPETIMMDFETVNILWDAMSKLPPGVIGALKKKFYEHESRSDDEFKLNRSEHVMAGDGQRRLKKHLHKLEFSDNVTYTIRFEEDEYES